MNDTIKNVDADPIETQEWLDALATVIQEEGIERAQFLLDHLYLKAREEGIDLPATRNTAYVNTIPTDKESRWNIHAICQWKNRPNGHVVGREIPKQRD